MSLYKTLFETQENKLKVGIGGMVIITLMLAGVFSYEAGAVAVMGLEDIEIIQATGGETKAELVEFIEQTYSIKVRDEELIPDNLDSLEKIARFCGSKVNS